MITIDRLTELVEYDKKTGSFTSRVSRPGVKKGSPLGTIRKTNGYLQICLDRKLYYAHRLAMMMLGHDIEGVQIDHIDGVKLNNCESNLRICRVLENAQNIKKAYRTNSLGVLGVTKAKQKDGYVAKIFHAKKYIHLGTFKTIEEASAAYISAKRLIHAFNTL